MSENMERLGQLEEKTLEIINQIRKEEGQRPLEALPPGSLQDEEYCPLALCLWDINMNVNVKAEFIEISHPSNSLIETLKNNGKIEIEFIGNTKAVTFVNQTLIDFVEEFDNEKFLHLINN